MRVSTIFVFSCFVFALFTTSFGVPCSDCPGKIRSQLETLSYQLRKNVCNKEKIRKELGLPAWVPLKPLNGLINACRKTLDPDKYTDQDLEVKACVPLGLCQREPWTAATCNSCPEKFKTVLKNFCAALKGGLRVLVPFCKAVVENTKPALYQGPCKLENGVVKKNTWGYTECNGVDKWLGDDENPPYAAATCNSTRQSPINLSTSILPKTLNLMTFAPAYLTTSLSGSVTNNGKTLVFTPSDASAHTVTGLVLGGDTYKPYEINFHWGSTNTVGSEHTIDGSQSAMEMQIYHQNTKYATLAEAKSNSDGLSALAFLIKVDTVNTIDIFKTEVDQIVAAADQFTETVSTSVNLGTFLNAVDVNGFYQYTGSLTVPECNANVKWIVFDQELAVSQAQMDSMRGLTNKDGNALSNNFRPTQDLNGRSIAYFN